ncbi:MAG: hypothetical protein JSS20_00605, partial [Proteobacteria bacterium]|nr:hypothetical protein [Pseudomonadota bacterium]
MATHTGGRRALRAGGLALAALAITALPLKAKEFTYSDATNDKYAKKLNIPVWFAVPASARAPLPESFNTTDRLVDFKHPDGRDASGNVGLRL